MQGPTKERWEELCAQAETEQDQQKFMNIIREINRLLDEKEARLRANRPKSS